MPIKDELIKQQQKVNRLEKNLAIQKIKRRKAETRHKIELGGLVVKSKMDKYPKNVILGALISVFDDMEKDKNTIELFKIQGDKSFMEI